MATLPALLWDVLARVEREYILEGAGSSGMPSLPEWANLLRAVPAQGTDAATLPATLRLSKRAVKTRLAAAGRRGWVFSEDSMVRLTDAGCDTAARWVALQQQAEAARRDERMRSALESLVARLPLEHPHYPASYGPADASITGGNGKDWAPVPRSRPDSAQGLPVYALISQVLVAFAIDYENISPVALSLSTSVIRKVPDEGRPLKGLGNAAGMAALQRHGFLDLNEGRVALTAKGTGVRDSYEETIAQVEAAWRDRFEGAVSRLREAL